MNTPHQKSHPISVHQMNWRGSDAPRYVQLTDQVPLLSPRTHYPMYPVLTDMNIATERDAFSSSPSTTTKYSTPTKAYLNVRQKTTAPDDETTFCANSGNCSDFGVLHGADYKGGDFQGDRASVANVVGWKQCARQCWEKSECVAASLHNGTGICYLKSQASEPTATSGVDFVYIYEASPRGQSPSTTQSPTTTQSSPTIRSSSSTHSPYSVSPSTSTAQYVLPSNSTDTAHPTSTSTHVSYSNVTTHFTSSSRSTFMSTPCTCHHTKNNTSTSVDLSSSIRPTCSPEAVDLAVGTYSDANCDLCSISIPDTANFVPPEICYEEVVVASVLVYVNHNGTPTKTTTKPVPVIAPSGYEVYTLQGQNVTAPIIDYTAVGSRSGTPCYTLTTRLTASTQQTGSRYHKTPIIM